MKSNTKSVTRTGRSRSPRSNVVQFPCKHFRPITPSDDNQLDLNAFLTHGLTNPIFMKYGDDYAIKGDDGSVVWVITRIGGR